MAKIRSTLVKCYPTDTEQSPAYFIELYAQPRRDALVAWLYHKYDMAIFKVPGFRRLEKHLESRHERKCSGNCSYGHVWSRASGSSMRNFCGYMPLSASQDIRCFDLSRKNRTQLVKVSISEEQYNDLKGSA